MERSWHEVVREPTVTYEEVRLSELNDPIIAVAVMTFIWMQAVVLGELFDRHAVLICLCPHDRATAFETIALTIKTVPQSFNEGGATCPAQPSNRDLM